MLKRGRRQLALVRAGWTGRVQGLGCMLSALKCPAVSVSKSQLPWPLPNQRGCNPLTVPCSLQAALSQHMTWPATCATCSARPRPLRAVMRGTLRACSRGVVQQRRGWWRQLQMPMALGSGASARRRLQRRAGADRQHSSAPSGPAPSCRRRFSGEVVGWACCSARPGCSRPACHRSDLPCSDAQLITLLPGLLAYSRKLPSPPLPDSTPNQPHAPHLFTLFTCVAAMPGWPFCGWTCRTTPTSGC